MWLRDGHPTRTTDTSQAAQVTEELKTGTYATPPMEERRDRERENCYKGNAESIAARRTPKDNDAA